MPLSLVLDRARHVACITACAVQHVSRMSLTGRGMWRLSQHALYYMSLLCPLHGEACCMHRSVRHTTCLLSFLVRARHVACIVACAVLHVSHMSFTGRGMLHASSMRHAARLSHVLLRARRVVCIVACAVLHVSCVLCMGRHGMHRSMHHTTCLCYVLLRARHVACIAAYFILHVLSYVLLRARHVACIAACIILHVSHMSS